jgi:hypothetical protein
VTPRFSFLQAEAVFYRGSNGSQPSAKEILWKIFGWEIYGLTRARRSDGIEPEEFVF